MTTSVLDVSPLALARRRGGRIIRASVARDDFHLILTGVQHVFRLNPSPEKRRFPRWGASVADFQVRCARTGGEAHLIDFSHAGMGLVLVDMTVITPGDAVSVELARGSDIFARLRVGVATGVRSDAGMRIGGPILGCEPLPFGPLAEGGDGDFAEIGDPRLVKELLERLVSEAPLMLAEIANEPLIARIDPSSSNAKTLALVIDADPHTLPSARALTLAFELDGGSFAVRGHFVSHASGAQVLEGPFTITSRARRRADRVRLVRGRSLVSWPHALVPGERVVAEVEDLSACGARVRVRGSSFPPPPGEDLILHVDGFAMPMQADVRHVQSEEDGSTQFGLRFAPDSSDDTVRLAREVERIRFPGLRPRDSRPREEVTSLLHASGYLELRESARDLTPWHDAADAALSVDSVHVGEGDGLDGHLSTTRVYSNTWVFHQLATLPGPLASRGRRALYLSATGWVSLLSEGKGYAMAYFDRKKRWHSLFFETFVKWVDADALAMVVPVDRFEVGSTDAVSSPGNFDVGEASEAELARALDLVETMMPPLLRTVMDLREGRLATDTLCEHHTVEGLARSRTVIAVREEGEPTAFALCELGSPSLSLFNLLNVAHLLVPPGASEAAQAALVAHVRAFYAERGTPQPILVAMPGTLTGATAAGLVLAETMGCMVLSPEGLKQYRNFLSYSLRAA